MMAIDFRPNRLAASFGTD